MERHRDAPCGPAGCPSGPVVNVVHAAGGNEGIRGAGRGEANEARSSIVSRQSEYRRRDGLRADRKGRSTHIRNNAGEPSHWGTFRPLVALFVSPVWRTPTRSPDEMHSLTCHSPPSRPVGVPQRRKGSPWDATFYFSVCVLCVQTVATPLAQNTLRRQIYFMRRCEPRAATMPHPGLGDLPDGTYSDATGCG